MGSDTGLPSRTDRPAATPRRTRRGAAPRFDLGPWRLLRELGRSPTGLGLVAVVGVTLLAGLGVVTLCKYRIWVQVASVVVDFSPAEAPSRSHKAPTP